MRTRKTWAQGLRRGLAAVALACGAAWALPVAAAPLNVTMLGTGSPVPSPQSFSQSTLVEAAGQKLLIDVGRGTLIRLHQLGIPARDIDAIFITHSHSDHVVGLPDLWLTGRLGTAYGSRTEPMVLFGPKGTEAMATGLAQAFAEDIRIRRADEKLPDSGLEIRAQDISAGPPQAFEPTTVYEQDGLRVQVFNTHHGDEIIPNFGYIVEFDGKKVVFSGDTTYDERVAKAAQGADLLIHEVAYFPPELFEKHPTYKRVQAHHTTPTDAGRIFNAAQPSLAAYSHIIVHLPKGSEMTREQILLNGTRETYDGPLIIGQDLMRFELDGGAVSVFNADGEAQPLLPASAQ